MINLSLQTICDAVQGRLQGSSVTITEVSTDTRTLAQSALFVALRGPNFDGHNFCEIAQRLGAKAMLVEHVLDLDIPQIIVADTRIALGQLGALVRAKCNPKVVAITGSCGKTTVKEMLASILERVAPTLATQGNLNNDIGVPLTLLRLTPKHRFAVVELGASYENEIAWMSSLAKPNVAILNNVTAAHVESFGSLDTIAKEKFDIFSGLVPEGVALANADDVYWPWWQQKRASLQGFGLENAQAQYKGRILHMTGPCATFELTTPIGSSTVSLQLPGQHQVANALAAAASAVSLGISLAHIKAGLEAVQPVAGRCCIENFAGFTVIDDSYNASLSSVLRALDLLNTYSGERVFVFGGMAELGDESAALHEEVAQYANTLGIEMILTFGDAARAVAQATHGQHFESHAAIVDYLIQYKKHQACTVLIKGARSAHMEQVVQGLRQSQEFSPC